jgi:hypothetical protein
MTYTQVPENLAENIQLNAGILLTDFDPSKGTVDKADIIGATTGGVQFKASAEYSDFGEDIDSCPKDTKELKQLESWSVVISGTFVSADSSTAKLLCGAADVADGKVTPRAELAESDFADIWWVGDTKAGGFVAIKVLNALSTGGFSLQTTDKEKGTYDFELTGHTSIDALDVVPFEVYFGKQAEA